MNAQQDPIQAPVQVVAGLLVRQGELLFSRRAAHQTHSGEWEFPGGKVEAHERFEDALARELFEEIGVIIGAPIFLLDHLVTQDNVHLHFYLVTQWQGEPKGQEGQHVGWYASPWFTKLELLPTNRILLDKLLDAVHQHTELLMESLIGSTASTLCKQNP